MLPDHSLTDLVPPYTNTTEIGAGRSSENRTRTRCQWNFFVAPQLPLDIVLESARRLRKPVGRSATLPSTSLIPRFPAPFRRPPLPDFGDLSWGATLHLNYNALQVKPSAVSPRNAVSGEQYLEPLDDVSPRWLKERHKPPSISGRLLPLELGLRHVFSIRERLRNCLRPQPALSAFNCRRLWNWRSGLGTGRHHANQTGGRVNVLIGRIAHHIGCTIRAPM